MCEMIYLGDTAEMTEAELSRFNNDMFLARVGTLDLSSRLEMMAETVRALEAIQKNNGRIPDGFVLQFAGDNDKPVFGWKNCTRFTGGRFYRLIKVKIV